MESFSTNEKSDSEYLEQLKESMDEKVGTLIQALDSDTLPKIEGMTRVMDIGVGGGEGVSRIKSEIKDPNLELYAVDILEPLVRRVYDPEEKMFGVVADLNALPFAERSFSAINVSAIIHEAISYNREFLEGSINPFEYLKKVLDSLTTILAVEGRIFYRDVGLQDNAQRLLSGEYHPALQEFLKWFDDSFRERFLNVTQTSDEQWCTMKDTEIVASAQYHRELQRHIISFLDYALRQKFGESLKNTFSQGEIDNSGPVNLEKKMRALGQDSFIYDSWQKREGSEIYTYESLGGLAEIVRAISTEKKTLVVESAKYIEREEYSRFLQTITNTPLRDTKQTMVIKREN